MSESSPFIFGRSVAVDQFYNRHKVIHRLLNRIAEAQSTAVVGQPHSGKTSLLSYLLESKPRQAIIGNKLDRCFFNYLDSQTLGSHFDQSAFWSRMLEPLLQIQSEKIHEYYEITKSNQFGSFTLEKFFQALAEMKWRLVLLLDEFDVLLNHPILNSAEFYGSLRSFASRYRSLTLVIATRRSLDLLNVETQKINSHGSPYFNIFTELNLGPFPQKDAEKLLAQAGERFNNNDKRFVSVISGNHPYLLQIASHILWELDTENEDGFSRYQKAAEEIYRQTQSHFADTWRALTNAERKVAAAIALKQIPFLVGTRTYHVNPFIDNLSDYNSELRRLISLGIIIESTEKNWMITQQALLWWLADEINRAIRNDSKFEEWLQSQELGVLLTRKERKKISQAAKKVGKAISKGATTLIESFAKGFGEGIGKTILRTK